MRVITKLFIACAAILFFATTSAHAGPTGNAKLEKVAGAIQDVLDSMDRDVKGASSDLTKLKLAGDKAHKVIADLCRKRRDAVDCSIVDPQGIMVAVEPGKYREVEGKNINRQEQVRRLHRTGKPVLSKMLKVVEGFYAVDLEWPVRSKKGELIGSVSMIVKPELFLEKIIKPELTRDDYNVWVMQKDGQVLYSRYKEAIGAYPTADASYIGNRSLLSALRETKGKRSGIKRYREKAVGRADPEDRALTWTTVGLHGTEWRVILFGKPQY